MHAMIIGMTESGKSTLGKILAKELKASGKTVAVLDPLCDPDFTSDFCTDDIEEMREWLESNRSAYVFVDESGQFFNEGNDLSNAWLATRSRHFGHSVFFLAQRAVQIPKTMRDQCGRLYLFTSSVNDGKIHAEEWNKPECLQCHTLPKLHFMQVSRFDPVKHLRIGDDYTTVSAYDPTRPTTRKKTKNA